MWILISIPIIILLIIADYNLLARLAPYLYGGFILLLIAVLFTHPVNGARSWFQIGFFTFQPGEFGKIIVILTLSYLFVHIQKDSRVEINKLKNLLMIFAVLILPIILLVLQPDYGTAFAYVISLVFMLFVAGIKKRYILTAVLIVAVLAPILYFFVLPGHAKSRIEVYLNPDLDPRGQGYNIIQSKLAIGAGKLFGMGWMQGTQTHLGFLYPKTTDFIFAVIGEELGFIASRRYNNNICYYDYKGYKCC